MSLDVCTKDVVGKVLLLFFKVILDEQGLLGSLEA
jgi:hypothetical protein